MSNYMSRDEVLVILEKYLPMIEEITALRWEEHKTSPLVIFAASEPFLRKDTGFVVKALRAKYSEELGVKTEPINGPTDDYYLRAIINISWIHIRGIRTAKRLGIV